MCENRLKPLSMHEALLYRKFEDHSVSCLLCRHRCHIAPDFYGRCRVRRNRDGTLFSLVYGRLVAEQVDPIEKKPLFHYLPGSLTYSIATVGCNFSCLNCQNFSIAQFDAGTSDSVPGKPCDPEYIVTRALEAGCQSISYTYTEPTIFFEYALDVAKVACRAGLKNIFVSNGYITAEALDMIAPYLHAANIDLKGFSEEFYARVTGARLSEVLDSIVEYHKRGIWLEITTLLIPGENDDRGQLEGVAGFIAENIGTDVPWHISRFFPQHKMTGYPMTSPVKLKEASAIAEKAGLTYVYEGNIPGGRENTCCPQCGSLVVRRSGYQIALLGELALGCPECGATIRGVWS